MMGLKVYSIDARKFLPVAPAVNDIDPQLVDSTEGEITATYGYTVDPKVSAIQALLVRNNPVNRHFAVKYEPMANSFIEITGRTITGEKVNIGSKRKDVDKVLKTFNSCINVRHQTIEDFIALMWRDNVTHGVGLWRNAMYDELPAKIDIQRIDQRTVRLVEDRLNGYRKWIQEVTLDVSKTYKKKKDFYAEEEGPGTASISPPQLETRKIVIPDEPNTCISLSLFEHPPVTAVMPLLLYKIWILYFMRKYSEKMWVSPLIGYIGDPKNNQFPYSAPEMQKQINDMARDLVKLRNFAAMATSGANRIEPLKTDTAKSGEIFVTNLRHLNEEIMNGLFGSMGQRSAQGNFKSVNDLVDTAYLRFLKGVRARFEAVLRRFYLQCLLPVNGITDATEEDIDIAWAPLEVYTIEDLMNAIKTGVEAGVFNDQGEVRAIASRLFGELAETPPNNIGYVPEIQKVKKNAIAGASGEGITGIHRKGKGNPEENDITNV